jgi:hypothetical protein
MATHTDHSFPHLRNLSRPMSELLADPLSELTRKRQLALLIAATIALLLSAGLVKVKEVGFAEAKFELQLLPHLATWLAVAITGYLLISYILVVWADWAIAKAKRWSPFAKIGDVIAEIDAEIQVDVAQSEEARRLKDELAKVRAEIQSRIDQNRNRQREESAHRDRLAHESVELIRTQTDLNREYMDRIAPIVKRMNELVESISDEPAQTKWAEREDINKTVGTFWRLKQMRLVLEVIFPAAYAVFALVWTVLHA